MQKKFKKLTACALVTMLCLSATMPYPVHATEIDQNADTGETQELDENAVPMDNTDTVENETNVQESENNPEPEQNQTDVNDFSDNAGETTQTQDTLETMLGSEPVMAATEIVTQAGDFQVVNGKNEQEWTYDESANTLTFNRSGMYEVRGNGQPTTERIIISDCAFNGTITLTNVHIDVSSQSDKPAFWGSHFYVNTKLIINLQGDNILKSGDNWAGLTFNNRDSSTLTISGSGSLNATGGKNGAGIGGSWGQTSQNITFAGGTIIATGGEGGAGIGGGRSAPAINIIIKGGIITATGGWDASGIGGGSNASGNNITIDAGTVTTTGGKYGAGIGGGTTSAGEGIIINGGIITARGNTSSAGIGGGANGSGNNITINGGTVLADAGQGGAGIGGGIEASADTITINGGTITATGIGIGRGGGYGSLANTKNITIAGGSVKSRIGTTPKNKKGNNVYLAKLENQDGIDVVNISSGEVFNRSGNHSDGDTAFYLYLAGGQTYDLSANGVQYRAIWNGYYSTFTVKQIPPVPSVDIDSQTASTITVKEPAGAGTYGNAQYRIDGGSWQNSRAFENLKSNTLHTVEVRYAGNNSFTESGIGKKENVNTATATYTITIPQETLTAGNESSKNEMSVDTNNFDLGYGGKVDVKVSNTGSISSDGNLTLTRQQATGTTTITSALLVNEIPFTNINNPVATFTMDNKDSEKVSISFAAPTEIKILAGTYSGTITFEVSYSQ